VNSSPDVTALKDVLDIPSPPGRRRCDVVLWIVIGAFLVVQGIWAVCVGLHVRSEMWPNTRSVRFQSDMETLYALGDGALRAGEAQAHLSRMQRPLRVPEVCSGIVHFYDQCLTGTQDLFGNPYFGLDYPPLRLTVAAFFVRHVQETHPDLSGFPARRGRADTVVPQDEDIMEPLLNLNTICELLAAVGMFPLVWVWVRRGAARELLDPAPQYPPGLVAFLLATGVFWYFYAGLSALPPRPTPVVNLTSVSPMGAVASVWGTVDGGQHVATWRVEWGETANYSNATAFRPVAGFRQLRVLATLAPLKPGQAVHLRMVANGMSGTSATADQTFIAGGPAVTFASAPVGGSSWPDWPVWLGMLGLFIAMVAGARALPVRHRAWACAWIAALLVWFDPITILEGHAWPQWDVWILPIFIFAALLASLNWWLCAGILLAIGCMLKGQMLLAGPVLFLWPIFEGKWSAAGRILLGFSAGAAALLWPWLINSGSAHVWIAWLLIGLILYGDGILIFRKLAPIRDLHRIRFRLVLDLIILSGALCLFLAARLPGFALIGLIVMALFLAAPWIVARRSIKYWSLAAAAAGVWAAAALLGGDFAWWKLGYAYGTVKHDQMQMGLGSFANFPSILLQLYHWDLHDTVGNLSVSPINWNQDLDLKTSLAVVYGLTLVAMSFAAAMHSRRKDPRILIALCAPWLLFPVIMCQTSERYLLWPSALSAAFVAVSTGFSLLHVLLAIMAAGMIGHQLLNADHGRWPGVFQFFTQAYPEAGFMMILLAAIFFFAALIPGKRRDGIENLV
jgi:hypothetical protein